MNRMMKKYLICIVFLFSIFAIKQIGSSYIVNASTEENEKLQGVYENINWTYENHVLTVSGTGEVPGGFAGKRFDEYAEIDAEKDIYEIKIKEGITSIGTYAFADCKNTEKISLPDNLEKIGSRAFQYCEKLKGIHIPESVSEIEWAAFEYCGNLEKINLPKQLKDLRASTFRGCSKLKELNLPEGLENIGNHALDGCGLEEIKIPESVISIGEGAFERCNDLTEIAWPEKITTIDDDMFNSCRSLKKVVLPEGITSIGNSVFERCSSLEQITIPETVTEMGIRLFSGCRKLKEIKLPEKTTKLSNNMFESCEALKTYEFGENIQEIGDDTFKSCTGLKYIIIPDRITKIGREAFLKCSNLEYIKLPEDLEVLRQGTFSKCSSLTSLELPSKIRTLENRAIIECEKLKYVKVPETADDMAYNSIGDEDDDYVIVGKIGSRAQTYAEEYGKKFVSVDQWKCDHDLEFEALEKATLTKDGLELKRCKKCGCVMLGEISHPNSVKVKAASLVYNGGSRYPEVEILLANGKILEEQYYNCVDTEDHIKPGTYKMQIILKDKYEGNMECTYKIVKADGVLVYDGMFDLTKPYGQSFHLKMEMEGKKRNITYRSSNSKILKIDAKGNVQAKSIGTCTVTAYIPESDNYKRSNEVEIKIRIIPPKLKLKTAKAKSGGKIYLKWGKAAQTDGYCIAYSSKKNMLGAKTIKIKRSKTTSITLKNLKRNKKYYINIQTYKRVKTKKNTKDILGPIVKKTIKVK